MNIVGKEESNFYIYYCEWSREKTDSSIYLIIKTKNHV